MFKKPARMNGSGNSPKDPTLQGTKTQVNKIAFCFTSTRLGVPLKPKFQKP